MRFSDQFRAYQRGAPIRNPDPCAPVGPVTCHWMQRDRGRLPKKVEIVLSPAACRYFGISKPQLLDKKRAERIAAWRPEE